MMIGISTPFSSRSVAPIAWEYLVPSLKTWPISSPARLTIVAPQRGQGSPASALRRSNSRSSGKSRPGTTPFVHLKGVVPGRDFPLDRLFDLRNADAGDPCPRCGATMVSRAGLEIGHVFKLGTKYSQAMGATYLDPLLVEIGRAHRLGVLGSELEDVADLQCRPAHHRGAAAGTGIAGLGIAQVEHPIEREVAAGHDAFQVHVH